MPFSSQIQHSLILSQTNRPHPCLGMPPTLCPSLESWLIYPIMSMPSLVLTLAKSAHLFLRMYSFPSSRLINNNFLHEDVTNPFHLKKFLLCLRSLLPPDKTSGLTGAWNCSVLCVRCEDKWEMTF